MNDDTALLRSYVEDDNEEGFTKLVDRHVDLVYNAALRRSGGNFHRAADVAQHVFTALARQAHTLVRHPSLSAWLHATTRNVAVNLSLSERRRERRQYVAFELEALQCSTPTPEWDSLRKVLDSAIDELPERDRLTVVMRFLERRAFKDIGVALTVSEDAARVRTERAVTKLRLVLERHGITSTAAALSATISTYATVGAPPGLAAALAAEALSVTAAVGAIATTALGVRKVAGIAAISAVGGFAVGMWFSERSTDVRTLPASVTQLPRNVSSEAQRLQPAPAPDQTSGIISAPLHGIQTSVADRVPRLAGAQDQSPRGSDVIGAERKANQIKPYIPKTWDERALAVLEVPAPDPKFTPVAVSSDYYNRVPVRPIYKTYPVYAPGKEPSGYFEELERMNPVVIWDKDIIPKLESESDWIAAGEIVFDSAIVYDAVVPTEDIRDPSWYKKVKPPLTRDGVLPFMRYTIREKGKVELGNLSCASCHTRVLVDGRVVKGAQGNFAFDKALAWTANKRLNADGVRNDFHILSGAPWLEERNPAARVASMSKESLVAMLEAIPAGVLFRHRSSAASPPAIPDLIGIRNRRFLDKSGLVRHGGIGDLMRYAALNNEMDFMSSFGGFIAAGGKDFRTLPDPADPNLPGGGRYNDEQLYALALYLYSLTPPVNPNSPATDAQKALVQRGSEVFDREDCYRCHAPESGYTNNKLIPAPGFTVPENHPDAAHIMNRTIGSDPTLTLWTRRGTGFYKVPSLLGLWYRGPFEHNGSVATLEDWFDARRLDDDYVPTGWRGPLDKKTRAVKGHEFGLDLDDGDRKALIAFLRTL